MGVILQSLNLPYVNSSDVQQIGREPSGWVLLPMKSTESKGVDCVSDLTSSSLGGKLADALERTRELIKMTKRCTNPSANSNANEAVLFLGMDSPELPMEEVVYGLQISSGENRVSLQRLHDEVRNHKSEHICIDNAGVETYGRAHFCPTGDGEFWGKMRIALADNVTAILTPIFDDLNRWIRTHLDTKTCSFVEDLFGRSMEPVADGCFPAEGTD